MKALDDFDGYKITYSINPGASARIVDGARGVEEGESLTFGVKNQIGFAVESVTANGEVLEADSIADNEDGSQTAWYTVPEVYEEQEVEVYTVETDIHPAFDAELVMDDGMVIHIVAEEGVLPAGVRATAVRVNDNVETAVQEIISADTKRNVSSVMAYDINLWLGDKLLDAEMWSGSRLVNVTFTGKPIIEQSAEADVVEVVCVETVQDSNKEEKEKAAAQESEIAPEDIVKVETVSDTVDVPGEQTVGEISFEAEHFTIYAVVSGNKQYDSTTIAVGEKLTLYNENNKNTLLNADWSVTSGSDVISFISGSTQKRNSIEIVGLKPGTAMVRAASSWGRNYSYTIIVTDTSGINAEYWITNREVTGSDGQQSKNISSTDLSQYGDNGVPVDEVAPSTGTRENDELIFWHARVLPANYHQTNNAGINRVENGQRIERLRFFNENIQYYTSSGSWKDFAATDQLVFYYLQRTELAKQVEIAVSDWWENSNDNTRKIEYELIDELSGNSMGSSLTSYHDKHPGVSGIYITPNLDNAYSVSKVTVDNVEINWENGFSVGWTKSSQTVTVRIYIKPNEANLQIQYLTEDGQPLTGELESSTLGVLTREGTDFNGYVRNGNLQNTKIEGYYGETYIIYTDLKSVSSLKEYALNYEYSSAAVSDNNTVLKLYYRSVSHEYTVNYYKDSISDRNFLGEVEGTGSVGDTIPADLTLFAPEGYAVPGTRSGAEKISADGGDVVNVVYSKKTNLSYTVNYYKDSIEEGNYLDKVEGTGTFGDAIPADLTKFAPAGYAVPGARSGAEKISADGGDVVNVVYSKDTFKYSVHYFYDEVEDEQALEQGIGEFESQVTTYKVKPRTKYALDYVENLPLTIGTDVSKNVINVYYALDDNEDEIPDKYQILFTYVSAGNGSVDGEIKEVHTFRDDNDNYIKPTPTSPKANITVNADDKYAFDYWTVDGSSKDYHINMDTFKTNTYLENTTFTVYFDKDEIGTNLENPDNPDGIPDKYQVVFEYRSEDTNRGTVYGTVKEVVTRPQNEDGSYNMEAPVYPSANVTVSGIGSYSFNNWTDGSRSYANADEIKAAGFTQSTTFTAQFNYNGGGGGTGGGGGGTSGGTTGNRRYTSTPGGPGFTTITPEDVPLAPLPESPVDVTLIDDGEVPLAPLPKTGQTSMRTTLTMMLSGIFVAVTALSKKRKEEDS